MTTPTRSGFVILLSGIVAIAWAPILFRFSEVGPIATAFWRVAMAIPFAYLWARNGGNAGTSPALYPSAGDRWRIVLSGIFFAGDLTFWHLALTKTSVANATLFANAAPLFVVVIAWLFFGARFAPRFLFGLALASGGALILMRESLGAGTQVVAGDLLGVVTALFLAGYLLTMERLRQRMPTATTMLWTAVVMAILLLPVALLSGERLLPSSLAGWGVLLLLGAVCQTAGQGLIASAMDRLSSSFTAVALLLQPVLAAIFGWLVLGEALSMSQIFGGAVILAGVLISRRSSRAAS